MKFKHPKLLTCLLLTTLSGSVLADTCEDDFAATNDKVLVDTCKAAIQGNAKDQVNLALAYINGLGGVRKDDSKAVEWLQKS